MEKAGIKGMGANAIHFYVAFHQQIKGLTNIEAQDTTTNEASP